MNRTVLRGIVLSFLWCVIAGGGASAVAATPSVTVVDRDDVKSVDEFFQDYAQAFRAKSTDRLLAKFSVPLTFLTKDGPVAFSDKARLSTNLEALIHRYERIGAVDWTYKIKEVRAIGDGIDLVKLEWSFLDARHEPIFGCETSYILAASSKTGAKVMAVIAHNENEEYDKALKRKAAAEASPAR